LTGDVLDEVVVVRVRKYDVFVVGVVVGKRNKCLGDLRRKVGGLCDS